MSARQLLKQNDTSGIMNELRVPSLVISDFEVTNSLQANAIGVTGDVTMSGDLYLTGGGSIIGVTGVVVIPSNYSVLQNFGVGTTFASDARMLVEQSGATTNDLIRALDATDDTTVFRIDHAGNLGLGIGTTENLTSQKCKIIQAGATNVLHLENANGETIVFGSTNCIVGTTMQFDKTVNIGSTTTMKDLIVDGDLYVNGVAHLGSTFALAQDKLGARPTDLYVYGSLDVDGESSFGSTISLNWVTTAASLYADVTFGCSGTAQFGSTANFDKVITHGSTFSGTDISLSGDLNMSGSTNWQISVGTTSLLFKGGGNVLGQLQADGSGWLPASASGGGVDYFASYGMGTTTNRFEWYNGDGYKTVTGWGTTYNHSSDFNTTTGIYTCAVSGVYSLSASADAVVYLTGGDYDSKASIDIYIDNTSTARSLGGCWKQSSPNTSQIPALACHVNRYCTAGSTICMKVNAIGITNTILFYRIFLDICRLTETLSTPPLSIPRVPKMQIEEVTDEDFVMPERNPVGREVFDALQQSHERLKKKSDNQTKELKLIKLEIENLKNILLT